MTGANYNITLLHEVQLVIRIGKYTTCQAKGVELLHWSSLHLALTIMGTK